MPSSSAFKSLQEMLLLTLYVSRLLLQDNDVKWASNDFQGKISHHGAGKPFKDGFSAAKPAKAEAKDAEQPAQEAPEVSGTRRIAALSVGGSERHAGPCSGVLAPAIAVVHLSGFGMQRRTPATRSRSLA